MLVSFALVRVVVRGFCFFILNRVRIYRRFSIHHLFRLQGALLCVCVVSKFCMLSIVVVF
jgi:hypothetical protein